MSTDLPRAFVDSNLWLYAFVEDESEPRGAIARALLKQITPVVSTQVINEVCVNLLRKSLMTDEQIGVLIEAFYDRYEVITFTRGTLVRAADLRQRHRFSFWDSLIVTSALSSGVSVLYSEDMQDGQVVDGYLTIRNALAASPPKS